MNRVVQSRKAFAAAICMSLWLGVSSGLCATADGSLRVEVITAYNLIVDSNAGTPASYAPRSAYIGVTLYNDGSVPLTDVFAYIGNYTGGASNTPGIYPSRTHPGLTGPLDEGAFALSHEGGRAGLADATRYIASIPAKSSVTVYWLIGYDQLDINGVPLWGTSIKPDDDLWLEYDVWATANEGATARQVDLTRTVTMRNEITASANKIFPEGANKVPDYYKELMGQYQPTWTNANYDGTVGTRIITEGYWYDFGNVGDGFDNDGDLVPDRNAWMQPVGNPALYDAGAFRLVKTYAIVIVKLSTGGELVLTGEDQLYFEHIPAENNGVVGFVRYEFLPLVANARSVTTPYQEVASGYDNEKFNADYGVSLGQDLISGEAKVTLDKTADRTTVLPGGSIAYRVTYTNSGEVAAGDPTVGLPLVVQDEIPAGTVYVSGSAEISNALPAGVSSYTVLYSTDGGDTWTLTEPSASLVTDLQWWLSDPLPAGGQGAIHFTVTVDNPYLEPTPVILNVAGISFGNTEPFATDDATTLVLGNNALGDTVYADIGSGTGGYLGNGIQDGSEPGLPGVTVSLYGNAGASFFGSVETDANGYYLFSDLPDGQYLVRVDISDASIPDGYTVTTPASFAIDLDSARASTMGVTNLTADFGFAPALVMTKKRAGTGNLREGDLVVYNIPVTNRLPGSGFATPHPAVYTVWPTNGTTDSNANKQWLYPTNAWQPGEPDGRYSVAPFKNANKWIQPGGYRYGVQLGAITNVMLVVPMQINGTFQDTSTLTISVLTNAVTLISQVFTCSALSNQLVNGILYLSLTSAKASWSWSDFNGTLFAVKFVADKASNPGATLGVDSAGFRLVTDHLVGGTDDTTLNPVPLFDNYDTTRLRYVSSVPAADAVLTNGTVGEVRWINLGPLYAGAGRQVDVTFKVLEPYGNISAPVTNTASITNAWFANGLRSNDQYGTNIATVLPAGTIGDFLWRDLDGDGAQDAGEPGIPGVTVTITPPAGVTLASTTTVTDASGYYLYEGLPASGTYTVAVVASTLPGGTGTPTWDYDGVGTPNRAGVPIVYDSTTGADTVLTADFGYTLQAVIRGTLWHDRDRDAYPAPEDGEERLTNVTVRLYASDGTTLLATTNTSAAGTYAFYGYAAATYVVRAVTNTGSLATGAWTASYDTDGLGSSNEVGVTLPAGGEAVADFSYYLGGAFSVGDTVYYDWDGDGVQDAGTDEGVANVTVRLYLDKDGDGAVDAGTDALVGTATTATNGFYLFSSLPAGTYQVVVDSSSPALDGYSVTGDPYGAKDGISVVTLSTGSNLDQDFGYNPNGFGSIGDTVWYDSNADGVQLGMMEIGISNVTVSLYADLDGDGSYLLVRSTNTVAAGGYLFDMLPAGAYRVDVDTNSAALPASSFGDPCRPTTATSCFVTLSGNAFLDADFGFVLPGAIGDTVYWDYNGNATQDWTEPGIPNVTLRLYLDANLNGMYDVGEQQVGDAEVTDANGVYMFHNLLPGDYVVAVDASSPALAGATLTGDPDNDGVPCPIPAVAGDSCDGAYGVHLTPESTFRGADFGYQPLGVIGDLVWIDQNTNGVRDTGEFGIPYVTVALYSGASLVATNVTDVDGYYLFGGLPDGTYQVEVSTNDTDFPASLTACYDADGAPDSVAHAIVLSGGHVTSIGGNSVSNADLTIDFGYCYSGTYRLSGTVGLDVPTFDGLLNGTDPHGVASGEYPFGMVTVSLWLWKDADTNNVFDWGEAIRIQSTSTATNGDYSFEGLPAGEAGDRYLVSLSAPGDVPLRLTTATGDTPALWVSNDTNSLGESQSAYQVVAIAEETENIDFAYESAVVRDFGDLPDSYSTTVADQPVGPSHTVVPGQNLWLGSGVSTEANGIPTSNATGDVGENGVVSVGLWQDGPGGGTLSVSVGAGSGWLVGWVDFNGDGTFTNMNERIVNQAVSSTENGGLYVFNVDVPAGTIKTEAPTVLNVRFRLYPSQPVVPLFWGSVTGGDVEDHQFVLGLVGNYVWEDVNGNGVQEAGELGVSNATVRLYSGTNLLETAVTAGDGTYLFTGLPTNDYSVVFVKPDGLFFTLKSGGGDVRLDSDADLAGSSGTIALAPSADRRDIDAGFYVPALLFGYVFKDSNTNLLRDTGDGTITNALVRLVSGGIVVASTNTDNTGYYRFENIPSGTSVSILVSRVDATLIAVPTNEPAASDQRRNRAAGDTNDAYIVFNVVRGYGYIDEPPAETLNFGFETYPFSTAIDFRVYADGTGGVLIDLWTVNESGTGDITVYAWIGNAWVEVGRVPAAEVVGEGSNRYTIRSGVLPPEGAYYFRIVDEAGHVHDSPVPVRVTVLAMQALRFDLQSMVIAFNTEYGCRYLVKVCDEAGGGAEGWKAEFVSVLRDGVWSGYSDKPFMAGPGTQTQVRVPVNRRKAFYKIELVRD